MTRDSDFIAEMVESLKDLPFEPFSEEAIMIRQRTPDLLMTLAALGFGGGLEEADRALAREQLHASLVHLLHLAEIGLAASRYAHGPQTLQ